MRPWTNTEIIEFISRKNKELKEEILELKELIRELKILIILNNEKDDK